MVRSIQELSQRNMDLVEVNSRMEMQNLQAQINPHFIYNTLDNIRYLIPADPQRAQQLIGRFIGILRYSINNTKHNVTVREDLKYLQDYLVIQSTRFGANFSYEIDIDDACMEFIIPKLLLQPSAGEQHQIRLPEEATHPRQERGAGWRRTRSISR